MADKKRAAALKYDPEDNAAPMLAAFGEGHVADRIIEAAGAAGVPVLPDPELAELLSRMAVGDDIPPELYEIVARVLIFVGEMDKKYGERLRKGYDRD